MGKLIEEVSDSRDRQLPQRGDQQRFAVDVDTGLYVNKGYSCTSDGLRGGIVELMPLEGAQFIHRDWNIVKSCRPRDVSRKAAQLSSWAMACIQTDLRHHIGRVSGTTTLDGRGGILLHEVIRCDEGGWVSIDDLVRMEVLWTAGSSDITESANVRDRDQRMRLYNERLQLIINGNLLNARKQGGKIRLQFLGVLLKEPPAGPSNLGAAGSNMMVSRQDQITELQRDQSTWHEQQWLGQCDGWIRPWAVRALSGHTVHHDPAKNLMELDPHKFAISPPLSLVNQIGGAFHATSCRNLFSVVERGILLGTSIQDDQYARYDTGRLHSFYGVFAPWDSRNTTTKQRVSGRGNSGMPMAVLYIPTVDLIRLQGRITDSGNIIVNRPVPFNLVEEVWFCVPKENDRRGFELIEKFEDALVLEYQASPILREFKKMKTPACLMQLLCEMPPGPHNAEKEKLLHNLAISVEYHHEDTRRHHHMKEAVIFMIKHTHPGDLLTGTGSSQIRLRLCPACYLLLRHACRGALHVGRCSFRVESSEGTSR